MRSAYISLFRNPPPICAQLRSYLGRVTAAAPASQVARISVASAPGTQKKPCPPFYLTNLSHLSVFSLPQKTGFINRNPSSPRLYAGVVTEPALPFFSTEPRISPRAVGYSHAD